MFDFDHLTDRTGTGALKWDRRTEEEKRRGYIPMSVADMEFSCAPCVRQAVENAARHGLYGYTDPTEAYFAAVCGWMQRRHGWRVAPDAIACVNGVIPAVSIALRALTAPGDRVIAQSPGYYPFRAQIEGNGRVYAENPLLELGGRWVMDIDHLEKLAANAKMLILCSPHNPVGRVWTRAELLAVSRVCERYGLIVLADEIHADIILEGRHTPFADVSEYARTHTVTCTSPSKAFNLAGLQLANIIIGNPEMLRAFRSRHALDGQSNISYFGFAAAIAAYTQGEGWLQALCEYLRLNDQCFRAFFQSEMPEINVYPLEGTYLVWTDWRAFEKQGEARQAYLRRECGLILDPGAMFGARYAGFERFNIALPRNILEASLHRLYKK